MQKALGLVEHGFTILLHEREAISGAIDQCALLQALLGQLTHLVDQNTSSDQHASTASASTTLCPQKPLAARLRLASDLCAQVLHLSVESAALFELLAGTRPIRMRRPPCACLAPSQAHLAIHAAPAHEPSRHQFGRTAHRN